ncbi:MAG: xylanase [Clostridiales bacterium]|nr:xylanase [Candidatus Blautia equi]
MKQGAFYTGKYRNRFAELGYSEKEIEDRKEAIFQTLFYGSEDERIYHPVGDDMGYMEDTGNIDARTEGMSYGMMMCVQTDHQEEFNRIWKWSKTYMFMTEGINAGYFAWSCQPDGTKNAYGAAPDGEEYYAMALFFASHRWGDGEGIFNYSKEAKDLLHTCITKKGDGRNGREMWDPENHLIRFIVEVDFSDPSYHLPHFYELFSRWAYEEDREFFKIAAEESRKYLKKACHPKTGLNPEYGNFDGTPCTLGNWGRHDWYYSDAYRTIANIAMDSNWFDEDPWEKEIAETFLKFYCEELREDQWDLIMEVDGTLLDQKVLHPVAVIAVNAEAGLTLENAHAEHCIRKFWNTPLREGNRRYYDNCLYFFAFLALSGNYRIY